MRAVWVLGQLVLATLALIAMMSGIVAAQGAGRAGNAAFVLGADLMRAQDYSGALREFNKAINDGFNKPNVFFKRGLVQVILGRGSKAIADFTSVLELDADDTSALRYRGEQYAKEGQLDEAVEDFTRLVSTTSTDNDAELLAAASKVKY